MSKQEPKNRGFTLIELIIVIAIMGIIAAVVIPNISRYIERSNNETTNNETIVTNETVFWQLAAEPIDNLNLTELNFMQDYCMKYAIYTDKSGLQVINEKYAGLTSIYQNQIIIVLLAGCKDQP